MTSARIRAAMLVEETAPSMFARHIGFLNPNDYSSFAAYDPKISVHTKNWEGKFEHPTVNCLTLGNEPYKLLPTKLITAGEEYALLSLVQQHKFMIEYVLEPKRVQKLFGRGPQKKPFHLIDIELTNDIQLHNAFSVNSSGKEDIFASRCKIRDIHLTSEWDSSTHVGKIINICSFSYQEFHERAGS